MRDRTELVPAYLVRQLSAHDAHAHAVNGCVYAAVDVHSHPSVLCETEWRVDPSDGAVSMKIVLPPRLTAPLPCGGTVVKRYLTLAEVVVADALTTVRDACCLAKVAVAGCCRGGNGEGLEVVVDAFEGSQLWMGVRRIRGDTGAASVVERVLRVKCDAEGKFIVMLDGGSDCGAVFDDVFSVELGADSGAASKLCALAYAWKRVMGVIMGIGRVGGAGGLGLGALPIARSSSHLRLYTPQK